MSYPKQLKLFKAWAKAMEQGATVASPRYDRLSQTSRKTTRRRRGRKFRRKRRLKKAD